MSALQTRTYTNAIEVRLVSLVGFIFIIDHQFSITDQRSNVHLTEGWSLLDKNIILLAIYAINLDVVPPYISSEVVRK